MSGGSKRIVAASTRSRLVHARRFRRRPTVASIRSIGIGSTA